MIGHWLPVARQIFRPHQLSLFMKKKCMLVHRPIPMPHFNLNADLLFVNLISS
jgi:hypothetical protein